MVAMGDRIYGDAFYSRSNSISGVLVSSRS